DGHDGGFRKAGTRTLRGAWARECTRPEKAGAEQHALTIAEMPTHSHGGTTAIGGAHGHALQVSYQRAGKGAGAGNNQFLAVFRTNDNRELLDPQFQPDSSAHQHPIQPEGEGKNFSLMPPYYALAFIMKVR